MKNVLITGAGRGIGLALTKEFLAHGYRVLATYRRENAALDLINLSRENPLLTIVSLDVSDEATLGRLKVAAKDLEKIDILVNNAGVIGDRGTSVEKLEIKDLIEVFQVNTFGPIRVTQALLPFMSKKGTIAQISSMMGSIGDNSSGGYYDYRMSKTALNMFNMCLSKEYRNLICLTLHPGWVQTSMGGQGAVVKPEESARGLFKMITKAQPEQSGQFYDYQGKQLPW